MYSTNSIYINKVGGPEVLEAHTLELPELMTNEVLVKHKAIGVNFVDTYYRSGIYEVPLPSGLGNEASGVIEGVGPQVSHLKIGDRVAYVTGPLGSYSEKRIISEDHLVKLPDHISFEFAASSLLKSLTVQYLFESIGNLKQGDTILFHAAAGGVGLIACQWAKHIGVKLIGTVSSQAKADIAIKNGAWKMINYSKEDISKRVDEITQGSKVKYVFDGVGKATWEASLKSLTTRGLLVSFGNASGEVSGINLSALSQNGSLFVTRPVLRHYIGNPKDLKRATDRVFELMGEEALKIENYQTFSLSDAAKAHLELNNRNRIGPIILKPDGEL